ncbi:MAG: response regulator transcription factor [Nocardioides sp.]|nr:response regulator transcription factor [Nocardioides sp.]
MEVLGRIWGEWFGARIRLAATTVAALARAMTQLSGTERHRLLEDVERLPADGHAVLRQYADPSGHWGPEGRAWVARLDAESLRVRWLTRIDPPDLADLLASWRQAETLFEDDGHVHEVAQVRQVLAEVLRACGDAVGSRQYADLARTTATRLGARPLLDVLDALGGTPVRGAASSPATLTAREAEILALVAEGRSHGEIARQLFISVKTVSVHVSHVLAKLGAAGRTEAAAIARRDGLLG